jgi:RNA recognition motif-containing protein
MYLANLGEEITEEVLRDLGGKYGAIDKIVIAKDMATGKAKGYAFVEYQRRLDCLKAIQALNNSFMNERYPAACLFMKGCMVVFSCVR